MAAEQPAGSLADRMQFPGDNQPVDWAEDAQSKPTIHPFIVTLTDYSDAAQPPQVDGAGEMQNGSSLLEPEFDVNVKLNDLQSDPNNPLYSVKDFTQLNLPEALYKGILALNFHRPSKIQERALPLLLTNPAQNLIGQSQSGTGKTAAFVLNALARIDVNIPKVQALVLAPSRELARQILGVIEKMGQYIEGLRTWLAVPDVTQRGKAVEGHIVVGTPGTVTDLIRRRFLEPSAIQVLVLDEADNMLDQQGLGDQCRRVKK